MLSKEEKRTLYNDLDEELSEVRQYITHLELRCSSQYEYESLHVKNNLNFIHCVLELVLKESD